MVNVGVVQGDPGTHIRVDRLKLMECGAALLRIRLGFELEHLIPDIFRSRIHLAVVPQGIAGVGHHHKEAEKHHQAEQAFSPRIQYRMGIRSFP